MHVEDYDFDENDELMDDDDRQLLGFGTSNNKVERNDGEVDEKVVVEEDDGMEMDVDIDLDDPIISEQNVYITNDLKNKLYCLQYPLRPAGRYIDLPASARIRPLHERLESKYALDTEGEYFDIDAPEHLRRDPHITLRSEKVVPKTHYAIGVLRGGDLHLNPIKSVLQMRASFAHIDDNDQELIESSVPIKEEKVEEEKAEEEDDDAVEVTVNYKKRESQWAAKMRENSYAFKAEKEESEPWIDLKINGADSAASLEKFEKLIVKREGVDFFQSSTIAKDGAVFIDNPAEYLNGICKVEKLMNGERRWDTKMSRIGFTKKSGATQVAELLKHGKILPFKNIYELATKCEGVEQALRYCSRAGRLVQGLWVCQSELLTDDIYQKECRDYILLQFKIHGFVDRSKIHDVLKLTAKEEVEILQDYAVQNQQKRLWFLKFPTDTMFLQTHEKVKIDQDEFWTDVNLNIHERISSLLSTKHYSLTSDSVDLTGDKSASNTGDVEGFKSKFEEALNEIFRDPESLGVYLESTLTKKIVELNQTKKSSKREPIWTGDKFPKKSFLQALKSSTLKIKHGEKELYVKNKYGDADLDVCRVPIIELFCTKESVKKKEVEQAVSSSTKISMRPQIYNQIMKELAISSGSSWILKSGK